uniref:Gamma-glutamyltranspeptidase n=1 Tax=Megaselia scalaris TaxID=36166 RepID=T1GFT9_MEGSC
MSYEHVPPSKKEKVFRVLVLATPNVMLSSNIERGTAVEAAIAILACECVASPDRTGFGGGFVALIYRHETRKIESLIATERSPMHSSEKSNAESRIRYVGVPGMLKGLWEMYIRYETTKSWKHLLHGTLELARDYVKDNSEVTKTLQGNLKLSKLINNKKLTETIKILINNEPKELEY